MTADRDALVEKIKQAMEDTQYPECCGAYGPDANNEPICCGMPEYRWPSPDIVASAALNIAMEEAARVANDFTGADHAAHDIRTGIFPKQSYIGEAIAAALRAYIRP